MPVRSIFAVVCGWLFLGLVPSANAQPISTHDLVTLTPAQLDGLYRNGRAANLPVGWVKGQALVSPGTSLAPVASRGAGLVWQGKRFQADGTARNRFFGLPIIQGKLSQGTSWLDGQPALILDYAETSRLYRPYRDEIREVAPGVFLGLMHDRRTSPPTFVRYFALQSPVQ